MVCTKDLLGSTGWGEPKSPWTHGPLALRSHHPCGSFTPVVCSMGHKQAKLNATAASTHNFPKNENV